ncbi:hypothetical protein [Magnetospira sp. QH-2]|uniref:hypothetical protein n=1 Tax=Magnetospira sp. (strain QH-2) TaxID=1288970 RepID=UPI0003E81BBB|nr:hypothetical protein [Magnetospira sp. QH-2]CCQ74728.1 conserved protein of unknown function [Magnetospira sp. QH-2]
MTDPTPQERADFVVRLLEDQIRDAKQASVKGMSFRKWQQIARVEIANAVMDAEHQLRTGEKIKLYLVVTLATAMVTIGFWGVVVSRSDMLNTFAAVSMGLAGLVVIAVVLGMMTNAAVKNWETRNRYTDWNRVLDLSKRIQILRIKLEKEEEALEEELNNAVIRPKGS